MQKLLLAAHIIAMCKLSQHAGIPEDSMLSCPVHDSVDVVLKPQVLVACKQALALHAIPSEVWAMHGRICHVN